MRTIAWSVPLLCAGSVLVPGRSGGEASADPLVGAARTLVGVLKEEHRALTLLEFEDAERRHWQYVPGQRAGLCLAEMTEDERRATHGLLRAALSARGYLKAVSIMELETVLREIENAPQRDPERYWITLFGTPDDLVPWGFRFEGHHLSLNFTCIGRKVVATPAFFGSNPAEVQSGRRAGWKVLAFEEDLAYRLLDSMSDEQRARAILSPEAPADLYLRPDATEPRAAPEGISATDLDSLQRDALLALIVEFMHNLRLDLAQTRLKGLLDSRLEGVQFSWRGSPQRGQPHYYRVHGRDFAIELDNVQNGANHVHALWSELDDDFGLSLLRRHYELEHPR